MKTKQNNVFRSNVYKQCAGVITNYMMPILEIIKATPNIEYSYNQMLVCNVSLN